MIDERERVTGGLPFAVNIDVPGMLHCSLVRSVASHARIVAIDAERARSTRGVTAVVTGQDLLSRPDINIRFGPVLQDQPILAIDKVRYVGEPVAAVVADDRAKAQEAAALVEVEYDDLPAVFEVEEAISERAPVLFEDEPDRDPAFVDIILRPDHEHNICNTFNVIRGDIDEGFALADHVFEDIFTSPAAGHVPLETHVAIADASGQAITVWTASQTPHIVRAQLASIFAVPLNRVRVLVPAIGGAFGAKAYATIEPLAAALSRVVRAPVKVHLTREESFLTSTKHAMRVHVRTGVTKDGVITARHARAYFNAGAYAGISPRKVMFGAHGINGPYSIPHFRADVYAVFTNTPPAGAYRGYAVNQSAWAYESQMDIIARELGIDPVQIRKANLLHDGDTFCTGETLSDLHFDEVLNSVAKRINWNETQEASSANCVRGKGVSCVIEGTITPSTSTAVVRLNADGSLDVLTSSVEIGQGIRRALGMVVAEKLGVDPENVQVPYVDTDFSPYDQQTTASRSMFAMGEAVAQSAEDVIRKVRQLASELLEADLADVEVADGVVGVRGSPSSQLSLGELVRRSRVGNVVGEATFKTEGGLDPLTGQGIGSTHWHQSAGAAEVEVDLATGKITVLRYVGAVFAGRVVDAVGADHQCEGCLVFGVGNALFEELVYDEGQLVNGTMADYVVPTLDDMPAFYDFDVLEDREHGEIHGLGEPSLPPVAAAIGNAVYNATGVRLHHLPMTAEKVLNELDRKSERAQPAPTQRVGH